ncbi:MAG: formylglycine-generating enzyme family protein, partial [Opitutales bacterium]|nr:formylglycine-generating enzyme family protein [Opitutales bacterium]
NIVKKDAGRFWDLCNNAKLTSILAAYGTDLLRDHRRLLALLEDFHPGDEGKGDRHLLRVALEQGIGTALLAGPPSPAERKRMENRLTHLFIAPEPAARIIDLLDRAMRGVPPSSVILTELPASDADTSGMREDGSSERSEVKTGGALTTKSLEPRSHPPPKAASPVKTGPELGQNINVELPGGVLLELVWIPSGYFVMGSKEDFKRRRFLGIGFKTVNDAETGRLDGEGPQTQVRLTRGYWLGRYVVTIRQWRIFVESTSYRTQAEQHGGVIVWTGSEWTHRSGSSWRNTFAVKEQNPVVGVSWNDGVEFCNWLTNRERAAGRLPRGYEYSLPSEAQWEYACRAGTTTRFYSGNRDSDLARVGWFKENSGGSTQPVGQKVANAWGLSDMHGNVWEWTRSWHGSYPGGVVDDFEGPLRSLTRVARGGCWFTDPQGCRAAMRGGNVDYYRCSNLGFRLALTPSP